MKARTQAAKLRQKRNAGRPRMEGNREPNGRLSRSGVEPADVISLAARRRQFGLTEDQAKDQRAGSFIGRLAMAGREHGLSQEQYEAALKFQALNNEMLQCIESPAAYYERPGASSNGETDAKVDWVRRTKERFSAASYAIHTAQQENRAEPVLNAVSWCVLQDHSDYALLGALRIGCNALCRHFRLDSAKR